MKSQHLQTQHRCAKCEVGLTSEILLDRDHNRRNFPAGGEASHGAIYRVAFPTPEMLKDSHGAEGVELTSVQGLASYGMPRDLAPARSQYN